MNSWIVALAPPAVKRQASHRPGAVEHANAPAGEAVKDFRDGWLSSGGPCDKPYVRLFPDGQAGCSVPHEDCGPRREGALPTAGQGASSEEVAVAAAPAP